MSKFSGDFWDGKYSPGEFIYGTNPNEFFKQQIDDLKPRKLLLPGDGEGRNSVYAAKNGWKVTAVDFSSRAKEKADKLALENNVQIDYIVSDISGYDFPSDHFDAACLVYLHLPPEIREDVHHSIIDSLKSDGRVIAEFFSKDQFGRNSGGPQNIDMLYSKEELSEHFNSMKIILLEEEEIELKEGSHHSGLASVIRLIADKK